MSMRSVVVLAAFSFVLPAAVKGQVVRNAYSEAYFLGATRFLKFVDKAGLTKLLKDPRGDLGFCLCFLVRFALFLLLFSLFG